MIHLLFTRPHVWFSSDAVVCLCFSGLDMKSTRGVDLVMSSDVHILIL